MSATNTPPPPTAKSGHREGGGFRALLWSEWVKLRTVRGWMIGFLFAVLLCVSLTFLAANGTHTGGCTFNGSPPPLGPGGGPSGGSCALGHPFVPTGPDGEAVADTYEYVSRVLVGNGTITVAVTSLTGVTSTASANVAGSLAASHPGLAGWAKAGILLTSSTKQGSPYAAVMTTGDHGMRLQYNYTHDQAGPSGAVSAATPRWLRLTRRGDAITACDSANGTTWAKIGTANLSGLPSTVHVGLFVTSPVVFQSANGYQTAATGTFHDLTVSGRSMGIDWHAQNVGASSSDFYPTLGTGSYHRTGGTFVIRGSGDIAPAVVQGVLGTDTASSTLLLGLIIALIVVIVIAAMFITAEYRRGLIRTTFTTTPNRSRVLAAKAVVMGAAGFVVGVIAAAVAIPIGEHVLRSNGNYVFPAGGLTELRIIVGSGVVVALTAVAVLALGTILRRSAGAVTAGVAVFVMPYILGSIISGGGETWLFRLTPAASFAILEALPRSSVVDYPYTFANGYYPLSQAAGLGILCAYTAVAIAVAGLLLRRRDA